MKTDIRIQAEVLSPTEFITELMKELRKGQERALPGQHKKSAILFLEEVIDGRFNSTQSLRLDAEKLVVKLWSPRCTGGRLVGLTAGPLSTWWRGGSRFPPAGGRGFPRARE